MKIGIIGYGFVGKAVAYGFAHFRPKIYDKYSPVDPWEDVCKQDIIFICLPTPYNEDTLEIDLSICDQMIDKLCKDTTKKTIVIKSTVVPGTTRAWAERYTDHMFVFNPEFLTEANALNDFVNPQRIVLGCDGEGGIYTLTKLYRSCAWAHEATIIPMSTTEAEMVKYQSNIMLAGQVSLANVVYSLCESVGADYDAVRIAVGMDARIGSHMQVTPERGFGGKCFPKDLGALIGHCRAHGVDCGPLEEIHAYNLRVRAVKDWRQIPGATVGTGFAQAPA